MEKTNEDILLENEALITSEYQDLCQKFGLKPAPLDIYNFKEDPEDAEPSPIPAPEAPIETTPHGTDVRNQTPAYGKGILVLPLTAGVTLRNIAPKDQINNASFSLDRADRWPEWRGTLWHEVIHQLSEHLGCLSPTEPNAAFLHSGIMSSFSTPGHGPGWYSAIGYASKILGTKVELLVLSVGGKRMPSCRLK